MYPFMSFLFQHAGSGGRNPEEHSVDDAARWALGQVADANDLVDRVPVQGGTRRNGERPVTSSAPPTAPSESTSGLVTRHAKAGCGSGTLRPVVRGHASLTSGVAEPALEGSRRRHSGTRVRWPYATNLGRRGRMLVTV